MAKLKFEFKLSDSTCISVNFRLLLSVCHVPGIVLRARGAKMEDAVTDLGTGVMVL